MSQFGWIPLPAEVDRICDAKPNVMFSDAAPHLKGIGDGKNVLFWEAEEKVLGKQLDCLHQTRGTCVSMGMAKACEDLVNIEIAWLGERESWPGRISTEIIYAGSRVEIGKGQLGGESDEGSLGVWAAEWVTKYGVVPRGKYGSIDVTEHNDDLACRLGARGAGVPSDIESIAKQHPISDYAKVTTYEQVRDALAAGKPVTVASSIGYTDTRDAEGTCRASGTWMHQMMYRGCLILKGNKPRIAQQQSWGTLSPKGNDRVTLEDGREIVLPVGVFLITPEDCTKQVRQGDSFTYAGMNGWQKLPETWLS